MEVVDERAQHIEREMAEMKAMIQRMGPEQVHVVIRRIVLRDESVPDDHERVREAQIDMLRVRTVFLVIVLLYHESLYLRIRVRCCCPRTYTFWTSTLVGKRH